MRENSLRVPRFFIAAAALLLTSCGYVGEPQPPSLMVPVAIPDLGVVERGPNLVIDFTAPALTTDGVRLRRIREFDLRAGPDGPDWTRTSRPIAVPEAEPGPVHLETPAAEWVGREIIVRVRAAGKHGRFSDWSNTVHLKVVRPFDTPVLKAESSPNGVRLTWTPAAGPAAEHRILKQGPSEQHPTIAATVKTTEYMDTRAIYGQPYQYSVQTFMKTGDTEAQSEPSQTVPITPEDHFPPAVPAGVTATTGIASISLSWDPDREPDLRGYYVYRAAGSGALERLGDLLTTPAYSDRAIESGKKYRFAVTAVDQLGNESARSAEVEAAAP